MAAKFITYSYDSKTGKYDIPGKPGVASQLYAVSGINHHIVGHKTTPAFGTDPFAQQRAEDVAVVALAYQLDCIISQEVRKMETKNPISGQSPVLPDTINAMPWCNAATDGLYPKYGCFAHLEGGSLSGNTDAPLYGNGPLNGFTN